MKSFKKLKTSLSASFESFVNEVENQEAVIDAAINEIKDALATTRIQIRDVERGLLRAQKNEKAMETEINMWRVRAKKVHSQDPEMAKDCVQKILSLQDEIVQCQRNVVQGKENFASLNKEKEQIQQKLREVMDKRHDLVRRQSHVQANCALGAKSSNRGVEDVFKRWEDKIVVNESHGLLDPVNEVDTKDSRDEVEKYFESKENESRLSKELDSILNNS